jgi:uncharacterized protein
MPNLRLAWNNSKLRRLQTSLGSSLHATEWIEKDELLVVWGGVIVTTGELKTCQEFAQHRSVQVEIDHHLCSGMIDDDADCINHSCDPNSGLRGQIALVAMRRIEPGEEICFDYAMSDAHPDFHMPCACGKPNCRGEVNGDNWKIPDLQERYAGYFSPYIAKLIEESKRVAQPHIQPVEAVKSAVYANGHSNGNGHSANGHKNGNGQ